MKRGHGRTRRSSPRAIEVMTTLNADAPPRRRAPPGATPLTDVTGLRPARPPARAGARPAASPPRSTPRRCPRSPACSSCSRATARRGRRHRGATAPGRDEFARSAHGRSGGRRRLLCDAMTSGGLLVACRPGRARRACASAGSRGRGRPDRGVRLDGAPRGSPPRGEPGTAQPGGDGPAAGADGGARVRGRDHPRDRAAVGVDRAAAAGAAGGRRGRPPSTPSASSSTRSCITSARAARGGCCRRTSRRGRPSTGTSATGARTARWTASMTRCASRCGSRRSGATRSPSAGIVDSQSVEGADTVSAATRGYDAGKKINGRKRHIVVDTHRAACWS